jgi:hypothetical protein
MDILSTQVQWLSFLPRKREGWDSDPNSETGLLRSDLVLCSTSGSTFKYIMTTSIILLFLSLCYVICVVVKSSLKKPKDKKYEGESNENRKKNF